MMGQKKSGVTDRRVVQVIKKIKKIKKRERDRIETPRKATKKGPGREG